ncbi:MAG: insulinase family protein [bacterium]|nr:insulinase family protein [bacterium]
MTNDSAATGTLQSLDLAPGLWQADFPSDLRLIVREDHRSPVAICNVWVRVGSNREPDALRGWSHGIEHMLFKGTGRRQEGDFAREVAEAGGSTNAGTGYETTNYHVTVPAEHLPTAVDLLGDALFRSRFDEASLDAEREVLVHENHMYDDRPAGYGVTWRWGLERAFDVSPYRHPIGGRDENLRERSRDDVLAFWHSAYRPGNMTVVVVGDVDPEAVRELVMRHFPTAGGTGPGPVGDPRVALLAEPPVETDHDGARCRVEYGDIAKAYVKLILPAPGELDPRRDALPVIRRILGDGRSCRLYTRVQEEAHLVDDIDVVAESGPREGLFMVEFETDPARLRRAMEETVAVLSGLAGGGSTGQERQRAANRVLASHLFGAESIQGQASNLGYHDSIGDLAGALDLPARMAAVTADDVSALARILFRRDQLTAMLYLPRGTEAAAHGIPVTDEELDAALAPFLGPDLAPPVTTTAERPVPAPPAAVRAATGVDEGFTLEQLPGGGEVAWRRDPAVPVIALSFMTAGGATGETDADSGLAALLQQVMVKGARGRSGTDLHGVLEGEGAAVGPRAQRDHVGLALTMLACRWERPLALAADILSAPDLAGDEVDQERNLALAQLEAIKDDPFQSAALHLRSLMYGDHPYGRPLIGTPESLVRLDREALITGHARAWTRRGLKIVVSGDLDPDIWLPRLDTLLADLPAGEEPTVPAPGPARGTDQVEHARLTRDQKQSVVLVAWPGQRRYDENRVPLMLLRQALNGQSGRLFHELRDRRSLCYNTGVLSTAGFGQGMFLGYVLTAPDTADEARTVLRNELLRTADALLTTEEFDRARTKLLGNLLIADQTNAARVGRAAQDRIYGRPAAGLAPLLEEIHTCTPALVRDAAAAYLDASSGYEVVLGP